MVTMLAQCTTVYGVSPWPAALPTEGRPQPVNISKLSAITKGSARFAAIKASRRFPILAFSIVLLTTILQLTRLLSNSMQAARKTCWIEDTSAPQDLETRSPTQWLFH
jgi:hypothetical protein